jgi:IclR family transcriptional regulator, KDG regulon repressor
MKQRPASPNVVQKALRILMAFSRERPVWGVRELSAHLGFNQSTVHRLLRDLRQYAFVDQDPETRRYRLGNIYYHFLYVFQSSYPVIALAKPVMRELAQLTQETVHLNLIEGEERICVESVESPQRLRAGISIGEKSPLYAGGSAKCLLAFASEQFIEDYLGRTELTALTENTQTDPRKIRRELRQVRSQGYATSLGERTPGLATLSAPIVDHGGALLAALSITMPALRYKDGHREFCLRALLKAASGLSQTMGYRDTGPQAAT